MITAPETTAILLAAGLSRRFGPDDKLLANYHGSPLALHAARMIAALPFGARIAVCRAGALAGQLEALGLTIVDNPEPELGMGHSLALGAQAAAATACTACAVFLADMPRVTPALVEALLGAYAPSIEIVASSNGTAKMPPALFGRRHFAVLAALSGDQGARALLREAPSVAFDASAMIDIDEAGQLT